MKETKQMSMCIKTKMLPMLYSKQCCFFFLFSQRAMKIDVNIITRFQQLHYTFTRMIIGFDIMDACEQRFLAIESSREATIYGIGFSLKRKILKQLHLLLSFTIHNFFVLVLSLRCFFCVCLWSSSLHHFLAFSVSFIFFFFAGCFHVHCLISQ